ncbi:hypothetical protein FCU94_17600 [Vibrio sp. JPW-9-11-11]|uniref:hypothetical protein n=1 Tax=Vibrio sp. JPW-9-11-11 TaxID=1416532 RepID=UPI001594CECF|nr:hypothetical protein [Vibrio sp. JPW-9-11-11]NVD08664.1 hypothetical protein [Vibrio sp. JPW-9-11-11]
MILLHRDYRLGNAGHHHAHVAINPVGVIDVDITESAQHHSAEFSELVFQKAQGYTRLIGRHSKRPWQVTLSDHDAAEVHRLIDQAEEEFEVLMCDL